MLLPHFYPGLLWDCGCLSMFDLTERQELGSQSGRSLSLLLNVLFSNRMHLISGWWLRLSGKSCAFIMCSYFILSCFACGIEKKNQFYVWWESQCFGGGGINVGVVQSWCTCTTQREPKLRVHSFNSELLWRNSQFENPESINSGFRVNLLWCQTLTDANKC